jgi:hypothetical protein
VNALNSIYPFHKWQPWLFSKVPQVKNIVHRDPTLILGKGFWENVENRKKYLLWIADLMSLESPAGYYRVTKQDIIYRGGSALLSNHGSILDLMRSTFPNYPWKPWLFSGISEEFWNDLECQVFIFFIL